jgi:tryptophanyl-tRNA synthetase
MSKKLSLTGIKPTGMPHLGNYIGAIKPALELAKADNIQGLYFIADYHALISVHDPKQLHSDIYEVAASWLACGFDSSRSTLYLQSQIPEITELQWILNCFTPKGLMNRAHAYKAKVQLNSEDNRDADHDVTMGLYNYPILMSADILFVNADIVPVGSDQLQHIEIARDIASTFNHKIKELFKLPEALINEEIPVIPGLDGRKMSKSYNNHIPLFLPEKKLRKMIMKITTDSRPPEEPKEPEGTILDLYKIFASEHEVSELSARYQNGIGWGEAKQALFEKINEDLAPKREIYNDLMADTTKIDRILREGTERVRPKAQKLLADIKDAIGVSLKS